MCVLKCGVWSIKKAGSVCDKLCWWPLNFSTLHNYKCIKIDKFLSQKWSDITGLKFHPSKPGRGRGSAPYRHSDWTSHLWAMSKIGQFKTTRECACSLFFSLDSIELCGTRRSYASRFRNCALQRAPVRWTLTSEPTIGGSLRLCQSRNGATNSKRRAFPMTSRNVSQQSFQSNAPSWPRDTRNKELNSRGKTKPTSSLL